MIENKKKNLISVGVVSLNKKASFNYEIVEQIEAGLKLCGSEVKSLRLGKCNIKEAFIDVKNDEAWLINSYIPEYQSNVVLSHKPRDKRKLLLHKKEISKLIGLKAQDGFSVIPLKIYFNDKGLAKILIGIGKGKKKYDKRETIKKRDWEREKSRLMKK